MADKYSEDILVQRKAAGLCETCGQVMTIHKQCKSCTVLVGHGHLEGYLTDGICDWCRLHPRKVDVSAVKPKKRLPVMANKAPATDCEGK